MKLIYITSSLPCGEGEAFVLSEIKELQRQGHEVLVVPTNPRGKIVHCDAKDILFRLQPLISESIIKGAIKTFIRSPRRAINALSLLITFNPVHLVKNLCIYFKGLWLAEEAKSWGAEHIHSHWAASMASMAMVASEASGIAWSFTAHRWDIVENNILVRKCMRAVFARFISKSGLDMALRLGLSRAKARLLHIGVELPDITAVDKGGKKNGMKVFTILCAANLVAVKGHFFLIQAIANLIKQGRKVRLLIAGDGKLRSALENQVAKLKLSEWVIFLGHLPHEKLLELYWQNQVDVFVLSSLDLGNGIHEGIPVALIEAMAFGVPAISTRTGGIPELLGDGAGILVPPRDPRALTQAIACLMDDPNLRRKLGQEGRKRVEKNFSVETVVRRLTEWFAEEKH